jgi:hypothetical protein
MVERETAALRVLRNIKGEAVEFKCQVDAGDIVFPSRPFARYSTKNRIFDPGHGRHWLRA